MCVRRGQADPLVLLSIQAIYAKHKQVNFSRITRTFWKIASKFGYLCKHKEFEVDIEENASFLLPLQSETQKMFSYNSVLLYKVFKCKD